MSKLSELEISSVSTVQFNVVSTSDRTHNGDFTNGLTNVKYVYKAAFIGGFAEFHLELFLAEPYIVISKTGRETVKATLPKRMANEVINLILDGQMLENDCHLDSGSWTYKLVKMTLSQLFKDDSFFTAKEPLVFTPLDH